MSEAAATRRKARGASVVAIARAQALSVAAVTVLAQLFSLARAAVLAVAVAATVCATVWYCSMRKGDGACSSASFPNRFCAESTWGGKAFPGLLVSLSRSRTVLLYSYVVSRRIGARPGEIALQSTGALPPLPVPLAPAVPVPSPAVPEPFAVPPPVPARLLPVPGAPEPVSSDPVAWPPMRPVQAESATALQRPVTTVSARRSTRKRAPRGGRRGPTGPVPFIGSFRCFGSFVIGDELLTWLPMTFPPGAPPL